MPKAITNSIKDCPRSEFPLPDILSFYHKGAVRLLRIFVFCWGVKVSLRRASKVARTRSFSSALKAGGAKLGLVCAGPENRPLFSKRYPAKTARSEEHTSELQSHVNLV